MATRYNYTGGIVTNGLVLNLDAAKTDSYPGTGTTWRDLSGNSNNGTLTNGPTFSGIGKQASIVFDGTNDFVNCGYSTVLNPSNNLTFSQWVLRTIDDSNIRNPIEMALGSDELYFVLFRGDLIPKRWSFGIRQSNNTYVEPEITGYLNLNQWYNFTFVANSADNSLKIYVNGIIEPSSTDTTYNGTLKVNLGATLSIGADPTRSRYFGGNVATTQIYNRALTAQEITQNFNALRGRYGI